uniref:Uncharacterized protein n=1 Tax=Arundo donax TaxID=35708 RepID=A0A0A8ZQ99_ARUDO
MVQGFTLESKFSFPLKANIVTLYWPA